MNNMTDLSKLDTQLRREVKEHLDWAYELGKKDATGLPEVKKELIEEVEAILESLIDERVKEARIDPFDFVESCEPDCSNERHAYHQGQWDMAGRINESIDIKPYPGAVEANDRLGEEKIL